MIVLGIESSCDDTSIAIVDSNKTILSNILFSQIQLHQKFGGVVPEIAARSHIEALPLLFKQAITESNISIKELDAIAVTAGPGLIGGLIVGIMFAKGMASFLKKPFVPVNHLEGHALTARLTNNVEFPYLIVLASGGHTQILIAEGIGKYQLLATTLDDAIGETFDKTAKMLGLGYPGGPIVEKLADEGNPYSFRLPKPLCGAADSANFSFSGLKTAVKQVIDKNYITHEFRADICASLQHTIVEILLYKLQSAINTFSSLYPEAKNVVISGGVAANKYIRSKLQSRLKSNNFNLIAPPMHLCTDNAAMIAWAGLERFNVGYVSALDFAPKARWSL